MSQAHIEQFYGKAARDQGILKAIGEAGAKTPEEFIKSAVKVGKANGFDFTYDEANAWIKNQQDIKAKGELSDSQLESVAGGKNSTSTDLQNKANQNYGTMTDPNASFGQQAQAFGQMFGNQLGSWLTAW